MIVIDLRPGDIFLTRSTSRLGKLIRFFTRRIGESRTKVNHVGFVCEKGTIRTAMCVEALRRVRHGTLWEKYANTKHEVAIFRPIELSLEQEALLVEKAHSYVGKKYGYFKLVTHFLDWTLQGAYVFRRLTNSDRYPICSWVVAKIFAVIGWFFGVKPGAASPDDIWDFVTKRKDKYVQIRELSRLGEEAE